MADRSELRDHPSWQTVRVRGWRLELRDITKRYGESPTSGQPTAIEPVAPASSWGISTGTPLGMVTRDQGQAPVPICALRAGGPEIQVGTENRANRAAGLTGRGNRGNWPGSVLRRVVPQILYSVKGGAHGL